MTSVSQLYIFFSQQLSITHIKDLIEISVISGILYYFALWLHKDQHNNLSFLFYTYCWTLIASYCCQLATLSTLLLSLAPVALLIFIVVHQETLQRNFITLKKIHKPEVEPTHWIDELMRICLNALNNHKEFICVIERTDSLQELLHVSGKLYADVTKEIFDIVFDKHVHTPSHAIILNQAGKLIAINARWKPTLHEEWISNDAQALAQWKQDAIFITSKTDALVFKINSIARNFDIIVQGKLRENSDAQQTALLLRAYLTQPKSPSIHEYPKQEYHQPFDK